MKRKIRNMMVEEYFRNWEILYDKKDPYEHYIKLGIFHFTGNDEEDLLGHHSLEYGYNKWNPVVWGFVIYQVVLAAISGRLNQYIKDFPEEWNSKHKILILRPIYEKYLALTYSHD